MLFRGLSATFVVLAVIQPVSVAAATFDITKMATGLASLRDAYAGAVTEGPLNDPVPLIGESINEVWSNDPEKTFIDILDWGGFIDVVTAENRTTIMNSTEIRDELVNYIEGNDFNGTLSNHDGVDSARCSDGDPSIDVTITGDDLFLDLCLNAKYARGSMFSGKGLFVATPVPYDISAYEDIEFDAGFKVGAQVVFKGSDAANPTVTIEPVHFSLGFTLTPTIILGLGMVDVAVDSTVEVFGDFTLLKCTGLHEDCLVNNPGFSGISATPSLSDFYLQRDLRFIITGTIDSGMDVPGLAIPAGGSVSITEVDAFNPKPVVTIGGLDSFEDYIRFSAKQCVSLIRIIDSALIRGQENQVLMNTNVPFTDKTFASMIATGQVLSASLLKFFVRTEPFDERGIQSLSITGSGVNTDDSLVGTTLELYYLEDELEINPDNFKAVRDEAAVCTLVFDGEPESDSQFADMLVNAINTDDSCGVVACFQDELSPCSYNEDTQSFYGCSCDVIAGQNADGNLFVASVSHTDIDQKVVKDVQYLGFFETSGPFEDKKIHGLPLNQPSFPNLIPRFRNMQDFADLINSALADFGMSFITVSLAYDTSGDFPEFQIGVTFSHSISFEVGFDGGFGIGDLVDISLDPDNSHVQAALDIQFDAGFGVILGPNTEDQIVVLGEACGGNEAANFSCPLDGPFVFELDYTMLGQKYQTTKTVPGSASPVNYVDALQDALIDVANVTGKGSTLVAITFFGDVGHVGIKVPKNCFDVETDNLTESAVHSCSDSTNKYTPLQNPYNITDLESGKKAYQLAVGDVGVSGSIAVQGQVKIFCTVLGVIEVEAMLEANFQATIELTVGSGGLLRFTDWLAGLTAITTPESDQHIPGFFTAQATLDANFTADVSAGPPFDFLPTVGVEGGFTEPWVVNISDIAGSGKPNISFAVDLPEIGNIKQMSFRDVVNLMVTAMEFLVGGGPEDSIDSCSGGLLGKEIFGVNVFTYQIPVLGVSVCNMAGYLQVVVNAVDTLLEETTTDDDSGTTTTTFSSLETKLTTLLQDGVGGTPNVDITTSSNANHSDMTIELVLAWEFTKSFDLLLDLETILEGETGDIANFAASMIPGEGAASINIGGGVKFTLGMGLEWSEAEKKLKPYILGSTAFEVYFNADGVLSYEVQAGPLAATLDVDFTTSGRDKDDPVKFRAGLNETLNYYILNYRNSTDREGFIAPDGGITGLIDHVHAEFDARADAKIEAGIALIGTSATIDFSLFDLDEYFRGNKAKNETYSLTFEVTPPSLSVPSFLDILLLEPQGIIDSLENVFATTEEASLGPNGIVTKFPIPFIRNSLGASLGAGTDDNIIGKGRRKIIPALQTGLDSFEGETDTVADVLARLMEMAMVRLYLLQENKHVTTQCYYFDVDPLKNDTEQVKVDCLSDTPKPTSLMWSLPFGMTFVIEIPMDFDLDAGSFPLEIELDGGKNAAPTLTIGWSFDLGFGFDELDGFFLYTFPGEAPDFRVDCLLFLDNTRLSATLLFLKAELNEMDIKVGARLYVDVDKEKALRKTDSKPGNPRYGRLTRADFKAMVKLSDLFVIGALAGATVVIGETEGNGGEVSLNSDVFPSSMQSIKDWIPYLTFQVRAQARKETGASPSTPARRMLFANDDHSFTTHERHPAHPLLRSLAVDDPLLTPGYGLEFEGCPVNLTAGETFCLLVNEIVLRMDKIADLIVPILSDFTNGDGSGYLDQVMDPMVLFLDERLPGVSDIMGKKVTVLDIAEIFIGPKSGAPTVRLIIKIYRALNTFVQQFADKSGIYIAAQCNPLDGFKCTGGVFDLGLFRRRRLDISAHALFEHEGSKSLAMTPLDIAEEQRDLAGCPSSFSKPNCEGTCSSCPGPKKAVCRAKQLKCKVGSVQGLSFPFMTDLTSLIGLLSGGDIDIVRFMPPPLTFAFEFAFGFVIYTPPLVELVIGFEFTVTLELGFNLDSKGIREAVTEKKPFKALNSFALIDSLDGVDFVMITATAEVSLSVDVSAVIVKIGVKGALVIKVEIDLFDAYPETSRGLVRPFELLSIGSNPLEWFEFNLKIFVTITLYVKIGIFIGFISIVLFSLEYTIEILIYEYDYQPPKPPSVGSKGSDGALRLDGATASIASENAQLECTSIKGTLGNEEVECIDADKFQTYYNVKTVVMKAGSGNVLMRGLQSQFDLKDFAVNDVTLDYKEAGANVIADNTITIKRNEIIAGNFIMKFNTMTGSGYLLLPQPEQAYLETTFTGGCENSWHLDGHSNIVVMADLINSGCNIDATGGEATYAKLTIDFGYLTRRSCQDGNEVILDTDEGWARATIKRPDLASDVVVRLGSVYTDFVIKMSKCKDTVRVVRTAPVDGFIKIETGGDSDSIFVGGNSNGLDSIYKSFFIVGGAGSNHLTVDDGGSRRSKESTSTIGSVLGLLNGVDISQPEDIDFQEIETLDIRLGNGDNDIEVWNTPAGSVTSIFGQGGADTVTVNKTLGDLYVRSGGGDDQLIFYSLGENTIANVWGEDGDDTITYDGTRNFADPLVNSFANTLLRFSGGNGDDTMHISLSSTETSDIELFDDLDGYNYMTIDCAMVACSFLSRENFLASVHDIEDVNSTMEKIKVFRNPTTFDYTSNVAMIDLRLNIGKNKIYFDDTFAPMEIHGGPQDDAFYVGQLYNSSTPDTFSNPIKTTLTSNGYLSNGISHPVSINGASGDDLFDILCNKQLLDINGDAGEDVFTVRSYFHDSSARRDLGELGVLDYMGAKIGDGADPFDFEPNHLINPYDFPIEHYAKLDDPDYIVNSMVSIEGGTSFDHLLVIGTEADDSFVFTDGQLLGGGLTIDFFDLEKLDLTTEEGNDLVTESSTPSTMATNIYGSSGKDRFKIGPRVVDPIVSKHLRGHRGIIEHEVVSVDRQYHEMYVRGVAVHILDSKGFVSIHEEEAVHVLREGENDKFSFWVYPTSVPSGTVVVNLGSQTDPTGNRYLKLNGSSKPSLELRFDNSMEPQKVDITYNKAAAPLTVTHLDILIKANVVYYETTDDHFHQTSQSLLPVQVKLIPSLSTTSAKAVTVVEPTGRTVVAEGANGFTTTYDIYLRPCTPTMQAETVVDIIPAVEGQVSLSTTRIMDTDWNNECKVSIEVTAVDGDSNASSDGVHFVTLRHIVSQGGNEISLSDGSTLHASDVLVEIHDDDHAGVIIEESLGVTATAEAVESPIDRKYYQDSYTVRLSKRPISDVEVRISSRAVAGTRDGAKEIQALVGDSDASASNTTLTLTFTPDDYHLPKTVHVAAVDDEKLESVDWLEFNPQPSYLSFIQGPTFVSSTGAFEYGPPVEMIAKYRLTGPKHVPHDYSASERGLPVAEQKENLEIYNLDVRGKAPSVGTLTETDFTGFNMAKNIVIDGVVQADGITYEDMEVLEIRLGDGVDIFTIENVTTAVQLLIQARGEDDELYFKALAEDAVANVYGGRDDDTVWVDGTDNFKEPPINLLTDSRFRWSGGLGNDTMHIKLSSLGDTEIDLFNDLDGINDVNIDCRDSDTVMLSRENFLANVHNFGDPQTTMERINLIREDNDTELSGWYDTASINSMVIRLNDGENKVYFDDTYAPMDILGGPLEDEFYIGQMFNNNRDDNVIHLNDPTESVLTTRGFLTNGISHPVTIHGAGGDDLFDVSRNKNLLDINGNGGNDYIIVRSFFLLEVVELLNSTKLSEVLSEDLLYTPKQEDPDYVINSLVDVDGGNFDDRLVVVGTEADDSYVLFKGGLIGGGLTLALLNTETFEVSTEEDNDLVSVLGTDPEVTTFVLESSGTDGTLVAPRDVRPVFGHNLRGHRGILEHRLVSDDEEYQKLYVPGVSVDILESDGENGGYFNVVHEHAVHVMTENGDGDFYFSIYPTGYIGGVITVNLISQVDPEGNRYVRFNEDTEPALELIFSSITPQRIHVTYNPEALPLDVKDMDIKVTMNVIYPESSSMDSRFERTHQSIHPINIKLLPGVENLLAKSVTVVEPSGESVVAEGENGLDTSYDVYLRPCTPDMMASTVVNIQPTVPNQLLLSKSSLSQRDWQAATNCRVSIDVVAVDDEITEGLHFVTLRHEVTQTGEDITLRDGSTLHASNVLVKIHDDDMAGIIITEDLGGTSTSETTGVGSLARDKYTVRLSKKPTSNVELEVTSIPAVSDRHTLSVEHLSRDNTRRVQALVNNKDSAGTSNLMLTFTPENWAEEQTVFVYAVQDGIEEGRSFYSFAPQSSYLSVIEGPMIISAVEQAVYRDISDPFQLPTESNGAVFTPPDGARFDDAYKFMMEEDQIDYLEIYSLDVRGKAPSVGTLTETQFTGFNMASDVSINAKSQPDGITYFAMEVIEIFLGDGVDDLTVIDTTEAMHFVDLRGEDDFTRVKTIDGPFIVHGGYGSDTVKVTSDQSKLNGITALFGFDGGDDDPFDDRLILDNSADPGIDEVLNVTKTMVRTRSMELSPDRNVIPESSYLIKLRGSIGGSFTLVIRDPVRKSSTDLVVPYPVSAAELESMIQRVLIPEGMETNSCGSTSKSQCSLGVKVWEIGQNFAIFFAGERLDVNVTLDLLTDDLVDFEPEMFQNRTNDIIFRNADVAYAALEYLDIIAMGNHDIVVNVRGTTAVTNITTQGGDDSFFISSEANQNTANAGSVDFLHGWLDYMEEDLYIVAQTGRHRLMISDESSDIPKGYGLEGAANYGPAVLSRDSLTDIHPYLGDIFFTAKGGNWSDGFNVWLGINADRLDVESIPSNPNFAPLRTTTSIHCGNGSDIMNVRLIQEDHDGAVFIANGQYGDDLINASLSSHSVILFGDGDDDTLIGGSNNDVLIGDYGRVVWRSSDNLFNPDGVVEAMAGQGGFGDFTDGVIRHISDIYSVTTDLGGSDTLIMNAGDDVGIGGPFDDYIEGNEHRDIIFGDSASIVYYLNSPSPKKATTINCSDGGPDTLLGGSGLADYIVGGSFDDTIEGNEGMDLVFGDHASIDFFEESHKLKFATTMDTGCARGDDLIKLGSGDDIAFGGSLNDEIYGDEGQDIILGDFGYYNAEVEFLPYQHYFSDIHSPEHAGDDTIYGGDDDDWLLGQEGNDTIYGGLGRDDIYGGHSSRTGKDANDTLFGDEGDDAILGDNGQILRHRLSIRSDYPWPNEMVWLNYVEPFEAEVVREIRRYDDIDYIQGNDEIYGGAGNDILHGQRGDDFISGGDGEDELYGELGSDTLDGGPGNDVILGDVGYAVRRYEASGSALLQDETRGAANEFVWHKDIVLEEVGNITGVDRISTKVDVDAMTPEAAMTSSLLFVATATKDDGTKFASANNGGWLTELICFQVVPADNDIMYGGDGNDVLIGQRGDDKIESGDGNNLVIGDAGFNTIPVNTDMPRIYQIYRALKDTSRSDLVVEGASDYGITFTPDYAIYPGQYQHVDIVESIIDSVVNVDDIERESNLLRDKLDVSAISTTRNYCLQPMFRITPGFLNETQWLHGNDEITTGVGHNIIIGDDIRGATGLDLQELQYVGPLRQQIYNLVKIAGSRLSTMEVDLEYFEDFPTMDYNISVGNDVIKTDIQGMALVTGDIMTILGRTVKAGSLVGNGLFVSTDLVDGIMQRLYDVAHVLWNFNFALYEIHSELLRRMKVAIGGDQKPHQKTNHHLSLANDYLDSHGDNDIVIGDATLLYMHVDRPGRAGFEFDGLTRLQAWRLRTRLRRLARARERDLDRHVRLDLKRSADEGSDFPLADIPFRLTVGCDTIHMHHGDNIASGDFGTIGTVLSARQVPDVNADLRLYADSFQNLRRPPQIGSNEVQYSLPTYENRYSESVAADVKPQMHADSFYGDARTNAAFGEFLTAYTYQTFSGGEARFAVDETADAYDIASATDQYDGDYFRMTVGAKISGQRGSDTVEEEGLLLDGDLTIEVRSRMTALFFDHRMITQLKNDMWYERINERDLKGLKAGFQCVDPVRAAYIPSAANYDISDRRDNDGEGDFSTYQDEKPGEPMSLNESVECHIVNGKRECD